MTEFVNIIPILLVVLASIVATLFALYNIWRYEVRETKGLGQLQAALQRRQKEAGQELVKLDELKKVTPSGSLVFLRLLTLERMRTANVKVDFGALQQITSAAESARPDLRVPAFAVRFVLLLGLFGTAAGLYLTLPELGSPGLKTIAVYGALAASFSPSLIGLLGSLWISLCVLALSTSQARFFGKFERFTVEELLPQTVPDIRNEAWLRQMHYKIGESFERIKEIAEQNHRTVKDFEVVAEGFSRLVDSLEQSARKGASADVQKVLGQMGQVIGQVSRANDSAVVLAGAVPEALKKAHAHNLHVLTRLDTLTQKTDEQNQKLVKLLTASNDKLPQTLNDLQQSQQAIARRVEEVLNRTGVPALSTAWPLSPLTLKLILYLIPPMFLLILIVLLAR